MRESMRRERQCGIIYWRSETWNRPAFYFIFGDSTSQQEKKVKGETLAETEFDSTSLQLRSLHFED